MSRTARHPVEDCLEEHCRNPKHLSYSHSCTILHLILTTKAWSTKRLELQFSPVTEPHSQSKPKPLHLNALESTLVGGGWSCTSSHQGPTVPRPCSIAVFTHLTTVLARKVFQRVAGALRKSEVQVEAPRMFSSGISRGLYQRLAWSKDCEIQGHHSGRRWQPF